MSHLWLVSCLFFTWHKNEIWNRALFITIFFRMWEINKKGHSPLGHSWRSKRSIWTAWKWCMWCHWNICKQNALFIDCLKKLVRMNEENSAFHFALVTLCQLKINCKKRKFTDQLIVCRNDSVPTLSAIPESMVMTFRVYCFREQATLCESSDLEREVFPCGELLATGCQWISLSQH